MRKRTCEERKASREKQSKDQQYANTNPISSSTLRHAIDEVIEHVYRQDKKHENHQDDNGNDKPFKSFTREVYFFTRPVSLFLRCLRPCLALSRAFINGN
jgi:hypothetical protein